MNFILNKKKIKNDENASLSFIKVIMFCLVLFIFIFNSTVSKVSAGVPPTISYSNYFSELPINNGSVTGNRIATIVNDTFINAGGALTEGIHYTLVNKPEGLTSLMNVSADGTKATLTFSGNANNHSNENDVTNLTITFLDGALTSTALATNVTNATDNKGLIDFITNTGTWVPVGLSPLSTGDALASFAISFDKNNVLYAAYCDWTNLNRVTVMKFNNGVWVPVGSINGYFPSSISSYVSIYFDTNNIPYVSYQDGENSKKASVIKFNGTAWENVGIPGFSAGEAAYVSMAISKDNIPYVFYSDRANGGKATVMKFNGTSWVAVGIVGFSAGSISNYANADTINIIFDSNNVPFVIYKDNQNGGKSTVMKFNGTIWENVGIPGFTPGLGKFNSFAFDKNDNLYMTYINMSSVNYIATVMKFNGISWDLVGTADENGAYYSAIAIDNNNVPYITYQNGLNGSNNTVKKFNGTSFVSFGNPNFSLADSYNNYITFDKNNNLYVSHVEGVKRNKLVIMRLLNTTTISYSNYFAELPVNNGSITGSRIATIINDTFINAGGALTEGIHYTLVNKPEGLTSLMNVSADGTKATLTFSGNANNHSNENDVTNLTITFLDGAFTLTPLSSSVTNNSDSKGLIDFITNGASFIDSVGDMGFSKNEAYFSISAIDSNNILYVAYADWGNAGKLTVKKFDGMTWVTVGTVGFSDSSMFHDVNIAIDKNNTPYVAYCDSLNNTNKITVKKFDGTAWVTVGTAGFSTGQAIYFDMVFDKDNIPYVVFMDYGVANKAVVKKFNGTTWVTVGVLGVSASTAWYPSLAFDSNNNLYLAYRDGSTTPGRAATVKKFDGTTWTTVGTTGFSAGVVWDINIAIDNNNVPYVIYQDDVNNKKSTVKKFNGTSWITVGVIGFSEDIASSNNIAFDRNNNLYASFKKINSITNLSNGVLMKFDGTSWIKLASTFSNQGQSDYISLLIDKNNIPYITYLDRLNSSSVTVLKYDNSLESKINNLVASPSSGQMLLSWDVINNDLNLPILNYLIKYKLSTNKNWNIFNHDPFTNNSIIISGLMNSTNYDFEVSLINSNGVNGDPIHLSNVNSYSFLTNTSGSTLEFRNKFIAEQKALALSQEKPTTVVTTPTTTPVVSGTLSISKTLKLKVTSNEVKELQKYLNAKDYIVAISGAGSTGKETTYFGPATKKAVIAFQKANKLKGDGIVGKMTVKVMNSK